MANNIQSIENLLEEHSFFKGLDPAYLKLIAGCGSNVQFKAEDYIFREGQQADYFYIIRYGRVALEISTPNKGPITIETVSEGDVLGWSWLYPPYKWFLDARATKLVRAVALDGICLREKCEEDPKLGFELMKRFSYIIAQRLQGTRLRLLDLYGAGN